MLKKQMPLFLILLSLISIKLSSDSFNGVYSKEQKVLELDGLKILAAKKAPASSNLDSEVQTSPLPPQKLKVTVSCTKISNIEMIKKRFVVKNQSALEKILGPWYLSKPEKIEYNYNVFDSMTSTAVYASGLYAEKTALDIADKDSPDRYVSSNIFYKLYYQDRSNSDTLFHVYNFYKKLKVDESALSYLKDYFKESTKHEPLSLELNRAVMKLSKDPKSLLGAFHLLKEFRGASAAFYKSILKEQGSGLSTDLAKLMIQEGSEDGNVNPHLEWSPGAYKAAYEVLEEKEMARSYLKPSELIKQKAEANSFFMDQLERVQTDCDLEEIWSIAGPALREL